MSGVQDGAGQAGEAERDRLSAFVFSIWVPTKRGFVAYVCNVQLLGVAPVWWFTHFSPLT